MPTLILEDVPTEVYQQIEKRAAAKNKPIRKEALDILTIGLQHGEGVQEQCRPVSGTANSQPPRLPEYIPSEEGPPPYDIPRPGPGAPGRAVPGVFRRPSRFIINEPHG